MAYNITKNMETELGLLKSQGKKYKRHPPTTTEQNNMINI